MHAQNILIESSSSSAKWKAQNIILKLKQLEKQQEHQEAGQFRKLVTEVTLDMKECLKEEQVGMVRIELKALMLFREATKCHTIVEQMVSCPQQN